MQQHFKRKYLFQGMPNQVEKLCKFQGVRGSNMHPQEWKFQGDGGSSLSKKLCRVVSIASLSWTRPRMTFYARMLKITSGVFIVFIALKRPYNKYYLLTESEFITGKSQTEVVARSIHQGRGLQSVLLVTNTTNFIQFLCL